MNEWAAKLDGIVTADAGLDETFAAGLSESSRLAFRVAFSVLRHREDAEDVAQEALTRAYRRLHQLRDAERLKAWLVRMTWRLALDRRRSADRRTAREERADQPPAPPSSEDLLLSAERSR